MAIGVASLLTMLFIFWLYWPSDDFAILRWPVTEMGAKHSPEVSDGSNKCRGSSVLVIAHRSPTVWETSRNRTNLKFERSEESKNRHGSSVLMIAHRLSTVRDADEIVCLREGAYIPNVSAVSKRYPISKMLLVALN